ncbi:MAG TPA: hypothetical protein VEO00_02845 [Actinomycetota bacterium]|nr:hypothetical protein [Actinomycetota bacterium]
MTAVLILLLIAAIFGVLGTVLKVALIIVLSVTLAVVLLGAMVWWGVRRRLDRFLRQQRSSGDGPGRPIDVPGRREADPGLPPKAP